MVQFSSPNWSVGEPDVAAPMPSLDPWQVRHHLPGRLRLQIPELASRPTYAAVLKAAIAQLIWGQMGAAQSCSLLARDWL
ncbi:MAG: hypothetical protein HC838_16640 [Spirulinaceae cyanobacterium RM2_2_10]|nr:hypothetical protein [Spirulinaceae cyanobacterium RM2_2_10]